MEELLIENTQNSDIAKLAHADISECCLIVYHENEVIIDHIKIDLDY